MEDFDPVLAKRLAANPIPLVVDGPSWNTPMTGKRGRVKRARLHPSSYAPAVFRMEGIGGYEIFEIVNGYLPLTAMQRREPDGSWKTWMIDDPLHWYGMKEKVEALPPGRILVAGLGLGLMVHHLVERADVTAVTVVELSPDVIALVQPTLPADPRITIVNDNYYAFIGETQEHWDGILWDLAVGGPEETRFDFIRAAATAEHYLPGAELHCFGLRGKKRTIYG